MVTETYAPEVNGVAMTLGRLAAGLTARGHQVNIVRPRQRHEETGRQSNGHCLTPGLPIPGYSELRFGLPVVGQLRRLWREQTPDVIHVATEGPLGFAALNAGRRLGIPVVSTFHTNFHTYSQHYGIGWLKNSIERYLRWFHNRTVFTLAPTQALAAELSCLGFERVGVLSRGVDALLFNPARRSLALRAEWGAASDDLVCIVVGRVAPEKNLGLALDAFAAIQQQHPSARMVCVGDGPMRESLARKYPQVRFVGARYGEELAAYYASADLFLFPSVTETFGNVVAEALSSGTAVVAFHHAAAASLLREGINGQCIALGDTAGFVAASCALAQHLVQGESWRAACHASIRHLAWENIHAGYEQLLEKVVHCHGQHWPGEDATSRGSSVLAD